MADPGLRDDVAGIGIRPRHDLAHVVAEVHARRLVVVDQPHLSPDSLREPDRGGVADAEVPGGPHRRGRIVRHAGDAVLGLGARDELS
jgi:hypothetical protein